VLFVARGALALFVSLRGGRPTKQSRGRPRRKAVIARKRVDAAISRQAAAESCHREEARRRGDLAAGRGDVTSNGIASVPSQ